MKTCTKCNILRGLEEFGKDKTGRLGLRASCKKCVNHYKKIYHQNNKDKGNTSSRSWRLANKEQAKANMAAWHRVNKEQQVVNKKIYYQTNKEQAKARSKAWQQANPDKCNAINAKRRSAKLKRTPSWLTSEDWNRIKAFYTEAQRLSKETGVKHEVDHIIPLQGETVSGFHHPDNLQILTKSENCKKGNK